MTEVVDSYGQVFKRDGSDNKTIVYPDLYIVDGSLLLEGLLFIDMHLSFIDCRMYRPEGREYEKYAYDAEHEDCLASQNLAKFYAKTDM